MQSQTSVSFVFPLLNSGEFFVTKLLLQGRAQPKDFSFSITVDDLPPNVSAVPLPYDLIDTGEKRHFASDLLIIGIILFLVGISFVGLLFGHWTALQSCWTQGIIATLPEHWILMLSATVAVIPTVILLVVGPMMIVGSFTNFSFPKRRRFRLPEDIGRRRFFFGEPPFHELPSEEKKG